jgi:hypothetical protein
MESPFQVSLILYLDSIECVPRGKKERLNPPIRFGKGAQSSSLWGGLAFLQCTSVNTQDARGLQEPLLRRFVIQCLGRELKEEYGSQAISGSPKKCKTPLGAEEALGTLTLTCEFVFPFEHMRNEALHPLLRETVKKMQDFATDFGGFLDVMDPTHRL